MHFIIYHFERNFKVFSKLNKDLLRALYSTGPPQGPLNSSARLGLLQYNIASKYELQFVF